MPRVIIAMLPTGTKPDELAAIDGLSPGVMSAGLARVVSEQTYLDITQGNRVFGGFYDVYLPFMLPVAGRIDSWQTAVRRAESAPADIVPGLLATTLKRAGRSGPLKGLDFRVDPLLLAPAVIAADVNGRYTLMKESCGFKNACPRGVTIVSTYSGELPRMIRRLRGRDLLIAIERAPPDLHHGLAVGIAGAGYDGNLVSDSTRLRGVVLSTDIAPTLLSHYGIPVPKEMTGRPIRSEGAVDSRELVELDARLAVVAPRRSSVIGTNLELFAIAAALAMLAFGRRGARIALAVLALACIYLPALLLLGAAMEPSRMIERALVGIGGPLLAGVTLRMFRGYWALAVACAVTVGVYAIDMIAGSALTPLSLMGPNPALGVRFYGIGNELEATLTAMTLVGTGAALSAWSEGRPTTPQIQAAVFVAVTVVMAFVFAFGRFGADVGAAIVLPVGGATAALYVLGVRGIRFAALVVLAPIAGVAGLIAFDALLGGDSHLSRSVLRAEDTQSLWDIASRRLRSSGGTFENPENGSLLLLAFALLGAGLLFRRRMAGWFTGRLPALAGFLGALVATVVGALANDSGALVLMLGTGVLFLAACFALSQSLRPAHPTRANSAETGTPAPGKIA